MKCPIALRSHQGMPCRTCTAFCVDPTVNMKYSWRLSKNGTYVNSQEVDNVGILIKPGDIITVGDVTLRVEGY